MFYCKAQVPGQQISTPPTLCTASFNRGGIWIQHMDAKPTQFLVWDIPLDKGITKNPKYSQELFCSKKSEDFENH